MILPITYFILVTIVSSKVYQGSFRFTDFQQYNGWIFINQFTFKPDVARIQIQLRVQGQPKQNSSYQLVIQGMRERQWEVEHQLKCKGVIKMPVVMQELKMSGEKTTGIFQFGLVQRQTYYFVIKDCHQNLKKYYDENSLSIMIRITVLESKIYQKNDTISQQSLSSNEDQISIEQL